MFVFFTEDAMKELREAIEKFGVGIGDSIIKVDSFLNHRIDVALSKKMGEDIATTSWPLRLSVTLKKFICGLPMKPATNSLVG